MANTELGRISAWAAAAAVTGPVKVRVARYLRESGVFTSCPKWDKSGGLLSCGPGRPAKKHYILKIHGGNPPHPPAEVRPRKQCIDFLLKVIFPLKISDLVHGPTAALVAADNRR